MLMIKRILPLLLLSTSAFAHHDIQLSGFGSFVYISDDIDNPIDSTDFSVLGVQATKQFGDLKAVVQVRSIGANDYEPELNWAFIEYSIDDTTFITAGRFITSFYEYSLSSYVGSSYIWTRPPAAVYGIDFDSIDGISLRKQFTFDEYFAAFEVSYGQRKEPFIVGGIRREGEVHDFMGFSMRLEDKYWTYRFNYTESNLTYDTPFFSALKYQDSDPPPAFFEQIDFVDDLIVSSSFYVSYEDDWVIEFEVEKMYVDETYLDSDFGYYISIGYQFDKFIPYMLYTKAKTELAYTPDEFRSIDPRPFWGAAYEVFYDIAELDYQSIGVGFRYDISNNFSISTQVEYYESKIPKPDEDKVIGSFSLDFTF